MSTPTAPTRKKQEPVQAGAGVQQLAQQNGHALPKAATGIRGLDEITAGGLPRGRPTLVCGTAGTGKTLMAMEFLVRGATEMQEPGVFMSFEERSEELAQNVRSLGFDLSALVESKLLELDYVHIERSQIDEAGEYDLEGIFIRLGHAIDTIGARRVVLDTIETLFAGLTNHGILRAELRRLFTFLKSKGVTAVITCERGDGTLTRHGLEEYVSDCVILLDHRVHDHITTRHLRVVKYRGTSHGADEYPFLIDEGGINVMPVTSLGLRHEASDERVSTGIARLDVMLGGEGLYRGSTILVSGTAGTGKTSIAAFFAKAVGDAGERCLYVAFEESPSQLMRNMRSIGLDLQPLVKKDLLRFHAARPNHFGLEMHLATIHKLIEEFKPSAVVIDPISNLSNAGTTRSAGSMLLRLLDFLKERGITAYFTSLTSGDNALESTDIGVSSLVDTWLLLRDIESNGERNRGLYVLKSRGMAHSNQIREFILSRDGVELRDVYVGPEGVLTGSSRQAQEARERAAMLSRTQEIERRQRELEQKRRAMEAQVLALQAGFEAEAEEMRRAIGQQKLAELRVDRDRADMARSRKADVQPTVAPPDGKELDSESY